MLHYTEVDIDFGTFLTILTRPDGFKPAGSSQEFIQGFQVFDKEGDGYISAGELRYGKMYTENEIAMLTTGLNFFLIVLTNLGEKLLDEEVDELLKEVEVGKDGRINYVGKCIKPTEIKFSGSNCFLLRICRFCQLGSI